MEGWAAPHKATDIHTHTHTLLRDFWRANNEGIKGEEAENSLDTHCLEMENLLCCAFCYGTFT